MVAIVDVGYTEKETRTAIVLCKSLLDESPTEEIVRSLPPTTEDYIPGEFYKRELSAILEGLRLIPDPIELIVVDAFVTLNEGKPGLGQRLQDILGIRVLGIAKNQFKGAKAFPVYRAGSIRPLWVSEEKWTETVQRMHGLYRIPTLLKRADGLSRSKDV